MTGQYITASRPWKNPIFKWIPDMWQFVPLNPLSLSWFSLFYCLSKGYSKEQFHWWCTQLLLKKTLSPLNMINLILVFYFVSFIGVKWYITALILIPLNNCEFKLMQALLFSTWVLCSCISCSLINYTWDKLLKDIHV